MVKIKKINFFIALIFGIYVKFIDLSFFNLLDEFTTVLLALLLLLLTISLLLVLNIFKANFSNNPIIFNIKISSIAILLKFWMKFLIKINKINKYLNIFYWHWFKLIFHYFNLFIFYFNFFSQNNGT